MATAKEREKSYRSRFKGFQTVEAERESLIEELLGELSSVSAQLDNVVQERDKLVSTLEADLESEKDSRREKQEVIRSLRERLALVDQARFVLVLIDADADIYLFNERYLKRGTIGGQEAADEFVMKVREHLGCLSSSVGVSDVQIVIKAFANLSGLTQACLRDGKLNTVADMGQFWIGFSRRYPQVDFVDVGSGKEEADNKIREVLRVHISNVQCEHILLACCHDGGYIPVLRQLAADVSSLNRLTLVEGATQLRKDISALGFRSTNGFESMFRSSGFPQTPSSPHASSKKSFSSIVSNTTTQPNDGLSATKGKKPPSPILEGKPVLHASRLRPVILNEEGLRIDKKLKPDDNFVQALKGANLCHWHYLRAECRTKCGHNHKYPGPLSPKEYDALWSLSRQNLCRRVRKGGKCEDDLCIYGHSIS